MLLFDTLVVIELLTLAVFVDLVPVLLIFTFCVTKLPVTNLVTKLLPPGVVGTVEGTDGVIFPVVATKEDGAVTPEAVGMPQILAISFGVNAAI